MIKPTGVHRFARSVYPLVLSVLSVLAILVSPLLTAMPAYAELGRRYHAQHRYGRFDLCTGSGFGE